MSKKSNGGGRSWTAVIVFLVFALGFAALVLSQ